MSTSTRILKNSGYLYAKMAFTVFVNLYSTRLILEAIGVSDFGIFGVVGGLLGMLGFLNATLSSTTSRFINYYQGKGNFVQLKRVFNNSLLLHITLAIFLCLLFEASIPFLFDYGLLNISADRVFAAKMICHFSVASTFVSIITAPFDASINAHENMLYFAITGIFESIAKLLIALYLFVVVGDKLIAYGFWIMILTIVMLVIKQIYCRLKYSECRIAIIANYSRDTLKELLGFSKWAIVSTSGILLGNYGNNIIMNHFFGTTLNAAQNISSQVKGQILALSTTMTKAMSPAIIKKAGAGDEQGMLKLSFTGTKLNIFLYAILGVPFIVHAPFILKIWLKNVPQWAICFSVFEVSTAMTEQFALTFHTMLIGTGNIKQINVVNFLTHIVPLFLCVIMFMLGAQPYWQYVIYAFSIGIITNFADIYYSCRFCGLSMKLYMEDVLFPCLGVIIISLAIGFLVKNIISNEWGGFIVSAIISLISYSLLMLVIGLNSEEKMYVKQMWSNLRNVIKK